MIFRVQVGAVCPSRSLVVLAAILTGLIWGIPPRAGAQSVVVNSSSSVRFLDSVGNTATDFPAPFTAADFANAQAGPSATVLSLIPSYIPSLPHGPNAVWIGTNVTAGIAAGDTALYAASFTLPSGVSSASLTLYYAVDNGLGHTNPGIYVNGTALPNSTVPSSSCVATGCAFLQEQIYTDANIAPLLVSGTNWIYFDAVNLGGPGGLIFSAVITYGASTGTPVAITNIIAGGGGLVDGLATSVSLPFPSSLAQDKNGNVYIASEETAGIYKLDASGQLTVLAGNDLQNSIGDGASAVNASLNLPSAVAVDPAGNLLVAQGSNSAIRKIDMGTGAITLVAGNESDGYSGDNGPATQGQLRAPEGVAVDANGNIFISDSGNNRIRRVDANTGIITTIAGNGTPGFAGDGGAAAAATISFPTGISVDSLGNIFFSDTGNRRVRRIDVNTGFISTVAGNGSQFDSGDGGPALQAGLANVWGVAVDSGGNLYLCDLSSATIRRVDALTGTISAIAGNGVLGFSGDGGPALSAALGSPTAVLVDASGNLLIGDRVNNRVRKVDAQTAIIATIAGNGSIGDGGPATRASLFLPEGVAVDSLGNVLVADTTNFLIRSVNAGGTITTIAGKEDTCCSTGDGGPAADALLGYTTAIVTDSSNSIFIAESSNHRVRRIDALTGIITTVVGNGTSGFAGDLGPAASASLNFPSALAFDRQGNLFIADSNNQRVRRVDAVTGTITTVAGNGTPGFAGDGGPATAASLNLTAPSFNLTAAWSGAGGMAIDASGNLFISDTSNHRVRRVDAATETIETVAGSTISCNQGQLGDGGAATSAALCFPEGLAMDPAGNLFIADLLDHRIRRVAAGSGTIATVAGTGGTSLSPDGLPGTKTSIVTPRGVALDGTGNLYVAAVNSQRIFRIRSAARNNALAITAVALPSGEVGVGYSATFEATGGTPPYTWTVTSGPVPAGVTLATSGVLSGTPTTAGTYNFTVQLSDSASGTATQTFTVTIAPAGTGTASATIQPTSLAFGNQVVTTSSTPQAVTITSTGTAPLLISSIVVSGINPADFPQANNCPLAPTGLGPGQNCQIFVTFAPTAYGARSAALNITANQGNVPGSQQSVPLTGTGVDEPVVASTTYNITGNPFTLFTGSASCPPDCSISGSFTLSQPLPPNLSNATITPASFSFTVGTTNLNQANVTSVIFAGISTDASGYITSWAISLSNANFSIVTNNEPDNVADSFTIVAPQGSASNSNSPATWPKTVVTPVTFNASPAPVSNSAVLNCPSGTVPCTDPNAHSLKLTVPAVSTGFTLTVTSVEVPASEANGICEAGHTEATDFDCRFVDNFTLQQNPNGDIVVPQCNPYSNGNCVIYRVSNTPQESYYSPGILEYIAWNNTSYTPPAFYNANNPRLFDDPDDPPYGVNHQFVFDITTYYKPTGNYVGVDNGIGGRTLHFNDFVVAYPATPSYAYTVSFLPPLSSTETAHFEQGDGISVRFKLSPDSPAGIGTQAPNHVGYSVLLDTNNTGCADFSGTIEPTVTSTNSPLDFTYDPEHQLYDLRLRGFYPAGQYKLLLSSNLAPEQCAVFAVMKDD